MRVYVWRNFGCGEPILVFNQKILQNYPKLISINISSYLRFYGTLLSFGVFDAFLVLDMLQLSRFYLFYVALIVLFEIFYFLMLDTATNQHTLLFFFFGLDFEFQLVCKLERMILSIYSVYMLALSIWIFVQQHLDYLDIKI